MKEEIEIPFGAKDSELYQFTYRIPEGYYAEIKDGMVVVKKYESEDERMKREILDFLKVGIWSPREIDKVRQSKKNGAWVEWLKKQLG